MDPVNLSSIITQLSHYLASQTGVHHHIPAVFNQLPEDSLNWLQQVLQQAHLLTPAVASPPAFEEAFERALQQNPTAASFLEAISPLIPASNIATLNGDNNILIQGITSAGDTTIILNKRKTDGN